MLVSSTIPSNLSDAEVAASLALRASETRMQIPSVYRPLFRGGHCTSPWPQLTPSATARAPLLTVLLRFFLIPPPHLLPPAPPPPPPPPPRVALPMPPLNLSVSPFPEWTAPSTQTRTHLFAHSSSLPIFLSLSLCLCLSVDPPTPHSAPRTHTHITLHSSLVASLSLPLPPLPNLP